MSNAREGNMTIRELIERLKKGKTVVPVWLVIFGTVLSIDADDDSSLNKLAFSIREKDKGAIYLCSTRADCEAKPFKLAINLRDFVRCLQERAE